MLRSEATYGQIRDAMINDNELPIPRYLLSRHSIGCLGLAPRIKPKKLDELIPMGEAVPKTEEVRDLALRIFYYRLKNMPERVETRELIPFLVAAMKAQEGKSKTDEMDEILNQLGKSVAR